jgi:signal recognition particle receptor subunit beta
MAKVSRDAAEVRARIVYWGVEGAGKTTNLRAAFAKLRPDHRGELREVRSRLDPATSYEVLPISLGEIAGIRTQIEMVAVPSGTEQGPTRKQLLDQVDGVVFVIDASRGRVQENLASFEELREALAAYGRSPADLPLVIQYNKRDIADAYALDDLHRKLDLPGAPVFEAVATEGTGVLQALSTISKRVIRSLRGQSLPLKPGGPAAGAAAPSAAERMEEAILAEAVQPEAPPAARDAQTLLDRSWPGPDAALVEPRGAQLGGSLSIVSLGEATRVGERGVRLPIVVADGEGGTSTLVLTLSLDVFADGDGG